MVSRRLLWVSVPALASLCAPAMADPAPQQKELARDLMQKGYSARAAHDPRTALLSFKGADDIMHVPTTGFEVARSQVDVGLLVEAHETLLGVLRAPERPGEPQAFGDARRYAQILDTQLLPRLPQLRIGLSGAAAASVAVDGAALPEGALLVPYKVDPGHHVVTATAEAAEGRAEIDVAEGETRDVNVMMVAKVAAPPPPPVAPVALSPPPTSRRHGFGPIAWAGLGLAAAGVVVGTATGILALTDKSSLASQCNGARCPPSTYGSLSSADTLATTSTVAFVAAGVGAAIGVTGWFIGRRREPAVAPAGASGLHLTPYVGLGSLGATGTF